MGRRGPPPKPAHLKALEGTPGKRPLKGDNAKPRSVAPDCPDWLSAEAKAEWKRLAPELERLGLLTVLDRAAFSCYCQSFGHWVQAQAVLREHGTMYVTASGRVRERPEVSIAESSLKLMRAFAVEFGLTPNSRSRFSLPDPLMEDDDEFER
jgi:P27 family predicted phage terminase small subunit